MEKNNLLLNFIDNSPSPYHAVENIIKILEEEGYQPLDLSSSWILEKDQKYYISINGTALAAFRVGNLGHPYFRIITSHSDSPGFKIKPHGRIKEDKFLKLNTEVYGGPILSTWFDRTLSIAGRVFYEGDNPYTPHMELLNIEEDLLTIPNIAIHMNPKVNKGMDFNPQKDTLPFLGYIKKELEEESLEEMLKSRYSSDRKIIGFDLNLYDRQKGTRIGMDKEFYHVGKLDNLAMAFSSVQALLKSGNSENTSMVCIFDHEEIGSGSRQGALSPILSDIIKRICFYKNNKYENYSKAMANSFVISADQAHGVHPNYPEKADPTHKPLLNQGPVLKVSSSMSYSSDGYSISVIKSLCDREKIPYQVYTNRSDVKGGSTLGPLLSRQLPIASVDLGNAIFAMHSIREMGGVKDQEWMEQLFEAFFD